MAQDPPKLPPKQEVALALLQTASSVYIHLDPRPTEVLVPSWFKKQPQLVLQVGLNMAVQIPDLDVGEDAITCTLSFNRSPEFCKLPYSAIFGLVGEDGRGMVWPESVPSEVAASAQGRSPVASGEKPRRPKLRVAKQRSTATSEAGKEEPPAEGGAPAQRKENEAESAPSAAPQPKEQKKKRELPPYLRVVK